MSNPRSSAEKRPIASSDYFARIRLSTVRVYLTCPFVLGWSLLEAMNVGSAIVASDTAPAQLDWVRGLADRGPS
jgi:hypothetical protein